MCLLSASSDIVFSDKNALILSVVGFFSNFVGADILYVDVVLSYAVRFNFMLR